MAKITAKWNGEIIAESNDTVLIEGNHYFKIEDVKKEYLSASQTTSVCPWKGTASYHSLKVGSEVNKDAVWYYPNPKEAAIKIKDRLAFWKGVEVTEV